MSMTARLFAFDPEGIDQFEEVAFDEFEAILEEADVLDVDKCWNALSWLFLACGAPTDPILGCDRTVGEDFGYGPILYREPSTVATVAAFLETLTPEMLGSTLSMEKLAGEGVYPDIWDRPDEAEENRTWVLEGADAVIALYRWASAGSTGCATVIQ